MRKVVDIVRNVSTCLGNVTCEDAKFVKYSADAAVFIGERIYGDAFHCLINVSNQPKPLLHVHVTDGCTGNFKIMQEL